MSKHIFVLLTTFWFHIIDDYYLQGVLAKMKQKKWWKEQPEYKPLYKYDWLMALICHGFSWSFTVHIPVIILSYMQHVDILNILSISIMIHASIHCIIDHIKCNMLAINLVTDQILHIIQILIIVILFSSI